MRSQQKTDLREIGQLSMFDSILRDLRENDIPAESIGRMMKKLEEVKAAAEKREAENRRKEKEEREKRRRADADAVNDVLFFIDTSGSISDKMIAAAFSEIKGAIDQFGGRLCGWLGFFDAAIIEPRPFASFEDVLGIRPAGGGGTDFQIIFEYVALYMADDPPACIIILTDGYAPFPKEQAANGIPVLWLINNDEVDPPWGKVARIRVEG